MLWPWLGLDNHTRLLAAISYRFARLSKCQRFRFNPEFLQRRNFPSLSLILWCTPLSTLFPYTTLFRSKLFETRSLPALTRSYPRHFTFYVARPTRSIQLSSFRLGCGAACPKPANSLFAVAVHWSRCVFLNPSVYPFSKACFRASSPPGGGGFWSLPPDSWYSKYF